MPSTDRSIGSTLNDFSLPPMVINEHYAHTQNAAYDFIPNRNHTLVKQQLLYPISLSVPSNDAPLLPPPRPSYIPFYSQALNKVETNPPVKSVQEEEYVEMSSRSPAYNQSSP